MNKQMVIGGIVVVAAVGLLAMVVSGSWKPSMAAKPTVYPAHGKFVFKNGDPVRDTFVNFIPTAPGNTGWVCQAQTKADGTFKITSNFNVEPDGAVPGEYKCYMEQGVAMKFSNGEVRNPSRIPKKFLDAKTSGLTVVIKSEDNDLGTIQLD
jgi:hypothetical protein